MPLFAVAQNFVLLSLTLISLISNVVFTTEVIPSVSLDIVIAPTVARPDGDGLKLICGAGMPLAVKSIIAEV